MSKPTPLDAIANISVTLYGDGQMAIQGNIGDANLAMQMLDHARDAVNNQLKRHDQLVVPNHDVDVSPVLPLTQYGDVKKEWQPELVKQTRGGIG